MADWIESPVTAPSWKRTEQEAASEGSAGQRVLREDGAGLLEREMTNRSQERQQIPQSQVDTAG